MIRTVFKKLIMANDDYFSAMEQKTLNGAKKDFLGHKGKISLLHGVFFAQWDKYLSCPSSPTFCNIFMGQETCSKTFFLSRQT